MTSVHQPLCISQCRGIPPQGFRVGIEPLIAKDDLIGVSKLMVADMMIAMHTGRIAEWADAWLTEDAVTSTGHGMPFTFHSRGKKEWVMGYNRDFLGHYGGPENTMHFKIDHVTRTGQWSVRMDFTVTTESPNGVRLVDYIAFEDCFTPDYFSCSSHGTVQPNPFAPNAAFIQPVVGKEVLRLQEEKNITAPKPTPQLQRPKLTRPCLHNSWDSIRTKKCISLLRCRTCLSQWKLPACEVVRCQKFFEDPKKCHLGTLCANLHVHGRKKVTTQDEV